MWGGEGVTRRDTVLPKRSPSTNLGLLLCTVDQTEPLDQTNSMFVDGQGEYFSSSSAMNKPKVIFLLQETMKYTPCVGSIF